MYFYDKNPEHKLIFAIDIIRHGDRTPVHSIPKLSDHWADHGLGTLTSLGAAKSEKLGKSFREYYIEQTKLLPQKYNANDILVRSTDYQRTEATAQNLLSGMYPEDHTDIRIVTYPKDQDSLLLPFYKYRKVLREKYLLYETSDDIQNQIQALLSKIGIAIEQTLDKPSDFLYVADIFKANHIHNLPIPTGLTPKDVEDIESIRNTLLLNRFKAPEVICKSSNTLSNVQELIHNFALNRDGPKYFLYVAHDYNLLALLGLLSHELDIVPPYNADLRFELLQSYKSGLLVRTSYNGMPVKVCGTEVCALDQFTHAINSALQQKCTTDQQSETPVSESETNDKNDKSIVD